MQLKRLLAEDAKLPIGIAEIEISGLTPDSRAVRQGFLFAALPGSKLDGARFAADAAARGAAAILLADDAVLQVPDNVPLVRVRDPRRVLALAAARFYSVQPDMIVAVTGTNGKTSIASFVRQIWAASGLKAASLGTIGLVRPDGSTVDSLTTPEPVTLHKMLAELSYEGVTHLSMEASSHGLEQRRLDGVRLKAGAFNNIGHDHLDYHPTYEDYFDAKKRLFRALLPEGSTAVINADAARHDEVVEAAYSRDLKVMTVGRKGRGIRLELTERDGFGQRIAVRHEGERYEVRLQLIGGYQAENALMAAGLCIATGSPPEGVFPRLEDLQGVPGRLEVAGEAKGGIVIVDYAHKPEALSSALAALRPFVTGKLICVIGCGGDRDRAKRPMMGAIASEQADSVIVTDDNPRTEEPASIRAAILAAAKNAREIGDRREAIFAAVRAMGKGDVVLVAGKGHETGQYVGDLVLPFSDQAVVGEAIRAVTGHG